MTVRYGRTRCLYTTRRSRIGFLLSDVAPRAPRPRGGLTSHMGSHHIAHLFPVTYSPRICSYGIRPAS